MVQHRQARDRSLEMGWIPVLALAGRGVRFFDLETTETGRKKSAVFDEGTPAVEDLLALARR